MLVSIGPIHEFSVRGLAERRVVPWRGRSSRNVTLKVPLTAAPRGQSACRSSARMSLDGPVSHYEVGSQLWS